MKTRATQVIRMAAVRRAREVLETNSSGVDERHVRINVVKLRRKRRAVFDPIRSFGSLGAPLYLHRRADIPMRADPVCRGRRQPTCFWFWPMAIQHSTFHTPRLFYTPCVIRRHFPAHFITTAPRRNRRPDVLSQSPREVVQCIATQTPSKNGMVPAAADN
jgi:hypothetical protein